MKRRRNPRGTKKNPSGLQTLAWAAASAAVGGLASYFVLREVYVKQIVDQCQLFQVQKQAQAAAAGGQQGMMPIVPVTKEQARAWF